MYQFVLHQTVRSCAVIRLVPFRNVAALSYQNLEDSIIPTMHFQKSLPRLPIPKLEQTCSRYVKSCKAILSASEVQKTGKVVSSFLTGEGRILNDELLKLNNQNKHTSYISEPWFDMYLKYRGSICINYNPFMAFAFDPDSKFNNQLCRSSNMVISALRFKRSLEANKLQPEIFHLNPKNASSNQFKSVCRFLPSALSWYGAYMFNSYPLDMSQYSSLFNSTRIPAIEKDRIVRNPSGRHILCVRNGHLFAVNVLNSDGTIKSAQEIYSSIGHILSLNLPTPEFPLAVLTSEERNVWATVRTHLIENDNEVQLNLIDSAIFVLCLDDIDSQEPISVSKSLLHGDGSNRWFDKSFSLIVQKSGLAAINFEHAWGDGVAVLRLMEELYKDSTRNHWVSPDTQLSASGAGNVTKIEFKLNDALKTAIVEAKKKFTKFSDNVQFNVVEYTKLTKDDIKKAKLSPDAIMQLAIQLAYYYIHQGTVATYESCSTAAFKHGRTETVRSATEDTKRFVTNFCDANNRPSNLTLSMMLSQCSNSHSQLVKEAAMGMGFDRHLFAIKHLAETKSGKNVPALYTDESYIKMNNIILSTSTLSTNTIILGGFGPVSPDCYGIGYFVGDKRVGCAVSTFADGKAKGSQFVEAFKTSLDEIAKILGH